MAPKKRVNRTTAGSIPGRSSRSTRSKARRDPAVNDDDASGVYESMLAEAGEADSNLDSDRPLKRRKVREPATLPAQDVGGEAAKDRSGGQLDRPVSSTSQHQPTRKLQTVEDSSDSDESEFTFEDVDLELPSNEYDDGIQDLSISVEPENGSNQQVKQRRRPVSAAEKSHRVFVHKLHILCLLQHCMFVNGRCNNVAVHRRLRPLLTQKVVSFLNPRPDHSQFQRNNEFMDGLQQALTVFVTNYRVTSSGLVRATWELSESDAAARDHGEAVDRADFATAAKNLEGSQDLGNQLFCALLRAAGVETRLICSLQTLPFINSGKVSSPQKPSKPTIYIDASKRHHSANSAPTHDTAVQSSASIGKVPSARRRLGQPGFSAVRASVPAKKAKHVRKLSYPVFWVEAFNAAHQKWIPVDPLVTHTVAKPSKLEPPSSYDANEMTYVIAFEGDGVARDVTKRYAKAYNAKTRRHRVEATGDDGARWWKSVSKILRRRGGALDRDQVEDAEMAQREAREGLPSNIQDFKDHPYYALERHLKRHEVIHPKREAGKVNAGTAANARMENVYRRQDVLVCRSADKWYRLGQVIQKGEQPLKQVAARNRRNQTSNEDDLDGEMSSTTGLYAPYQTEQYVPAPVQRGRITKNAFGNLDIYVPSMVPAGGVHIRHTLAQRAARVLRIDYADAVTGFQFKGRHGTAIIDGVVVAEKYADAIRAIIEGFEDEVVEDESRARSLHALKLWKRFLIGLRIAERVKTYGDASTTGDVDPSELDDELEKMDSVQDAGGFFPGEADETPLRTAGQYDVGELTMRSKSVKRKKRRLSSDGEDDAGVISEPDEANQADEQGPSPFPLDFSNEGGGFVVDDDDGHDDQDQSGEAGGLPFQDQLDELYDETGGGGFIADDEDDDVNLFGETDIPDTNAPQTDTPKAASKFDDQGALSPSNPVTMSEDQLHLQPERGSISDAVNESPDHGLDKAEINTDPTLVADARAASTEHESDRGSMLSHDPEDEDLEPDWLESD